ncbi:MAG: dephospho-CoA kinase [Chlorobiaceae bacterium]|nr:dephospho-CoA kinase [Chlorobiaceae bacterium]NTV60547.1 dephospho-CoA kinase [Chlorobiaceae bacterium]
MKGTVPYLLGVTGGLGSGKSTVCRFLSELGCRVFEADNVARELQIHDPEVVSAISLIFGQEIYFRDASGVLVPDRKKIASIVFSFPEKLAELNKAVHPAVFREFTRAVKKAGDDGVRILVKEAAILFEAGGDRGMDAVIVVAADMQRRIERAVRKGLGSAEEIKKRIASQLPQEQLIEKADYVIMNNGSEEELKKETESVYSKVLLAAQLS